MDRDKNAELDQLMKRASQSVLKSLDAEIDVDQRLHELFRAAGVVLDASPQASRDTPKPFAE